MRLIFFDFFGDSLVDPLRLRISLWGVFNVRTGRIFSRVHYNASAEHYGVFQTTLDIILRIGFFWIGEGDSTNDALKDVVVTVWVKWRYEEGGEGEGEGEEEEDDDDD